jgi:hypothetical protein
MKQYYAKSDGVATVEMVGGKLTAQESKTVKIALDVLGLKRVSRAEYLKVKETLPPTKRHVSITVGDDGTLVTKED